MKQIDYVDVKKRLTAAQAVFADSSTPKEKLNSIRIILKGMHPELESHVLRAESELGKVEKVLNGEVLSLSAEAMPEGTEEEKKRKKAVLGLFAFFTQLKKEIARVEQEFDVAEKTNASGSAKTPWEGIFRTVKGPMGIITIVAVGVVGALHVTAVDVVIENRGCSTIESPASFDIKFPGVSLPDVSIQNGESAVAAIPPVPVTIDGTRPGILEIAAIGFSGSYPVANRVSDIQLDEASLLGVKTEVNLLKSKQHTLTFVCGS
ncbi:hypothetical protein K2P56_03420 [Patescibacteria group bacterium]|nr:hypothetical protein [Patescibacteria group bacterium]